MTKKQSRPAASQNTRLRVDITIRKGFEELLPESFYSLLPASGLWIDESDDMCVLKCYPTDLDAFRSVLASLRVPAKNIHVTSEIEQDYSELTKAYFRPIQIEKLTVLAPWNKSNRKGPRIYIEPGMAFGTGRHESTRLMIKLMDVLNLKNKEVLDVGCGSAILSLYAATRGAHKVHAVDMDKDAILSARKNIRLNRASAIQTSCKDLRRVNGTYDVILANIDIGTFRATSSKISRLLRKNGYLVVSGVLARNQKELISLFPDLVCTRIVQKNSWRGFLFKKLSR